MKKAPAVSITWSNLSAVANQKVILNQNQGYCKPGQMLAIMGPSGAGKTTLLSLIAQKPNSNLRITGQILANGFRYNSKTFYQFGTFVYQNDLLYETLTVRQTLQFSAFLKIKDKTEAERVVQQLISQFELQKCQDTYIGGLFLKGISGGQKKRVCIAIEMVANPSVIILDEPTSGLDSNKAARVLTILRKLANNGQTIIFTIHQPSYLQFVKLDRLVLLNKGQVIYQGLAKQVSSYLESIGVKVNTFSTISDFFMMEISDYKQKKQDYSTPFDHKNYSMRLLPEIQEELYKLSKLQEDIYHIPFYMETFWVMFALLSRRNFRNYWRNFMKFGANLITAALRSIFVGLIFMNWIPSRQAIDIQPYLQFQKIQGLAFLNAVSCFLMPMFQVSLSIPVQRQLYYKEVDSKKYTALPYYLSKIVIQLMSAVIGTTISTPIVYWVNGYTSSFVDFLSFYLVMILMTIAGNAVGFFCGTLFRQVKRVSALTPIIMIPMMLVSGVFNKLDDIPVFIRWLQYLSPFRYGSHMVLLNEFKDEIFLNGAFNYKMELAINLSFEENGWILLGLSLGFYICSFLLLLKFTKSIVA